MKSIALAVALLLCACARQAAQSADDNTNATDGAAALSPGVSPIRIGEGGPGFAACGTRGTVINLSSGGVAYLTLRAAPFDEASEIARLDNGTALFLCTRSIDQKWQGVVVPPVNQPSADCGVAAPITAPRAYGGPCRSGWVASDFVRIGGGG